MEQTTYSNNSLIKIKIAQLNSNRCEGGKVNHFTQFESKGAKSRSNWLSADLFLGMMYSRMIPKIKGWPWQIFLLYEITEIKSLSPYHSVNK